MANPVVHREALAAVRIKLGDDEAAPQPDPLGRSRVGYKAGLSPEALWERGRGVWKAKLTAVADRDLLVLTHHGVVVLVGTVDGVTFAGERVAVTGRPDPSHPLIGQPDPLANASRNPVAYGEVYTTRPSPNQRAYSTVLADAIKVLTEAARLRRPVFRQTKDGKWEPDPSRTEPIDWPEFVTLALAGTAANVGSVWSVLAGRPGSWEAAGVESLLDSTVGPDGEDLWRHRTEPVRISATVAAVLAHFGDRGQYLEAEDELDRQEQAEEEAAGTLDWDALTWLYTIPEQGDPVPQSPEAPAWSWETYRQSLAREGWSPKEVARAEKRLRDRDPAMHYEEAIGITLPKSAEAEQAITEHENRRSEISRKYEDLRDQLAARRRREWAVYAAALTERLEQAAAALPGLDVPVEISIDSVTEEYEIPFEYTSLEWKLLEQAATEIGSGS